MSTDGKPSPTAELDANGAVAAATREAGAPDRPAPHPNGASRSATPASVAAVPITDLDPEPPSGSGRAERLASLLHHPPSDRFLLRLAIAAAIVVVAVFTNRTFLGWGLFVTLAVLFVPVGRARSFILSFVPYAMTWFLFGFFRSFADETILARTLNGQVARLERWLFGGQLPTIWLQEQFFDPAHLRWQDYFLTGIHWSYFLVPHLVAIRLWQTDPPLLRRYLSATALLLAVGLGIYFLIPANPPWLAPDPVNSPTAAQVVRVMEPVGRTLGGGIYAASYRVIGESNPIAAMPSIHMAITFLLVFVAAAATPRWRTPALVYAALMGLALVYLGEHYVVDVLVGMLVTAYGWFAAGVWLGRVAPVLRSRFARPALREAARGAGI